jgi:hypothetical protein
LSIVPHVGRWLALTITFGKGGTTVVKDKIGRHPVSDFREERTEIVSCGTEDLSGRRERYIKLINEI